MSHADRQHDHITTPTGPCVPRYRWLQPHHDKHFNLTVTFNLDLTYDLDSQFLRNYDHDPYKQNIKLKDQSLQKIEWKQTDRQTDCRYLSNSNAHFIRPFRGGSKGYQRERLPSERSAPLLPNEIFIERDI